MKTIRANAKRIVIVYLALPLLGCMTSVLLYQFVFSVFDPEPLDIAPLFMLLFTLTYVVYFASTLPALLIRLLRKGPIEKKLVKILVAVLLCALATACCMLVVGRIFESVGGSITSLGLFVFLGAYLLLDMQNAEEQVDATYAPSPAFAEPQPDTAKKPSFLSAFKRSKNKEPQQDYMPSAQSVQPAQAPAWYIYVDGQTLGPYTREEIAARAKWGSVAADTLVWDAGPQGGNRGWISAQDAGFFGR